jgi:hypothetical protein
MEQKHQNEMTSLCKVGHSELLPLSFSFYSESILSHGNAAFSFGH